MDKSNSTINYLKTFAFTLILVLLLGIWKQIWIIGTAKEFIGNLCDIFLIAGLLVLATGIMTFATSQGFFDGLGYSTQTIRRLFSRDIYSNREDYYEYKVRRAKKHRSSKHLIIIGSITLLISILCLTVYMMM